MYSDLGQVNYYDFMHYVTERVELSSHNAEADNIATDLDCHQWSLGHLSGSSWPVWNRDS